MTVIHSHREGLRETRDTLDLRDCKSSGGFTDKILIIGDKDDDYVFNLTMEDFKWLYKKKLADYEKEEN